MFKKEAIGITEKICIFAHLQNFRVNDGCDNWDYKVSGLHGNKEIYSLLKYSVETFNLSLSIGFLDPYVGLNVASLLNQTFCLK